MDVSRGCEGTGEGLSLEGETGKECSGEMKAMGGEAKKRRSSTFIRRPRVSKDVVGEKHGSSVLRKREAEGVCEEEEVQKKAKVEEKGEVDEMEDVTGMWLGYLDSLVGPNEACGLELPGFGEWPGSSWSSGCP